MKGITKAVSLYKQLGEDLPLEVFHHLSSEEIEKLILKMDKESSLPRGKESIVLKEFIESIGSLKISNQPGVEIPQNTHNGFSASPSHTTSPSRDYEEENLLREIQNLLDLANPVEPRDPIDELETMPASQVSQLIVDEPPGIVAQILFFTNQDSARDVIISLPNSLKEEVILQMGGLDFHSQELRDDLNRFLSFKMQILEKSTPTKLKKSPGRQSKKAAAILSQLNPKESQEILSKIQKKRPEFAENIIEHYYSFRDLLLLGRKSLSDFFSNFHPLVIATALKGVEIPLKEEILMGIEPWVAKQIRLECDSLGAVSLAEIEESHRGILDRLREEIEEGKLKLWRFR